MTETEVITGDYFFTDDMDYSYLTKNRDPYIKTLLLGIASLATVFVFMIIFYLFYMGGEFFLEVPLDEFFSGTIWLPNETQKMYGALPIIVGTILVTFGSVIISIPLGLATAIFIAEIASPRVRKALKFIVEILAGVPSIVFGFFGILVINPMIGSYTGGTGASWLSGSLILAIMSLPTIITVCDDAIRAVPNYYREGSYALGATRWQTIRKVVIPAGISGITAAIILGVGRALGETMAMVLVVGNSTVIPNPITDIFSRLAVITATIARGYGEAEFGTTESRAFVALGIVLFVMTFIINTAAMYLLSRTKKKFEGTSEKKKKRFEKIKNKESYKYLQKYKKFILFSLIFAGIVVIMPDIPSKITYDILIILLSVSLYSKSKLSKETGKLVTYGILLVIIGWVFYTWWGLFYALLGCILLLFIILVIRYSSVVAQQRIWLGISFICTILTIGVVALIVGRVVVEGLPVITQPGYFTTDPLHGGIYPAIIGTFELVLFSLIFALVLGIPAGIYLSDYAKKSNKLTKIIRSGIDNLNGTPSIVFGLFGSILFVKFLNFGISLIAGALTLGLMILPTIIRTTEEAIKSVPQSFREGSLALGSSKWQGIAKIVFPAAAPGIVTGAVLGMGRSAGETAPIMFTGATSTLRFVSVNLMAPVMVLSYSLYTNLLEGHPVDAAGIALTLLLLVLLIYGVVFLIRSYFEKKKKW
ncbi:MAG: phosphate ABC transporter permease subunit PstC [Candidatus Lokiarchaeota archaeon]|nr:phosphate ABC transporter permease subunit PstC [Candidatus Lokiarchaeota archaeon]